MSLRWVLVLPLVVACASPAVDQPVTPAEGEDDAPAPPVRTDGRASGTTPAPSDGAAGPETGPDAGGGGADARTPDGPWSTTDGAGPADTGAVNGADAGVMQYPHLPVLWIQVPGQVGDIKKDVDTTGTMKVIQAHDGLVVDQSGVLSNGPAFAGRAEPEVKIALEVRGTLSATFEKKSFNLELRDDQGADRSLPLLGMQPESDWVLVGCFLDTPCLRNPLAYSIGRTLGRWAPDFRFVEVVFNGRYHGLYLLLEKVKRDRNRVNVPAQVAGGDVSGGYLFVNQGDETIPAGRGWTTGGRSYFHVYPNWGDATAEQKGYIKQQLDGLDTLFLRTAAWNHPTTGYRARIDVASWVDYALVQEWSKNYDGYWRSLYFHKQSAANGDRFFMGPLWDYDLAFGNCSLGQAVRTSGFAWDYPSSHPFVKKLVTDGPFRKELRCRWEALHKGVLASGAVDKRIDDLVTSTREAQVRDRARWSIASRKIGERYASVEASVGDDVKWLREWIGRRSSWLATNLPTATCP